ncbi:MAG: hypothetical protein F4052_00645 [Dehalococcoidia bacterium]|nr:hypothetical protein [Dehalococcoidia bacterium]MYK25461.1 hypothetical protein [Dehalococcoidia bacterium]
MTRLAVGVGFVSLLMAALVACGGGDPAPPASPAETQPAATSPTATAAISPTPSVAATSTASVAAATISTPIRIVGPDNFVAQVGAALSLLQERAPGTLLWVEDKIETIFSVPFPTGTAQDVIDGVVRVAENQAFVPGFAPSDQVIWLAAELVYDACLIDLYRAGWDYSSNTATVSCLEEQLAILELTDKRDLFVDHVRGLIRDASESDGDPTGVPAATATAGGIRVEGSNEFVEQVEAALQLLSERAPEALVRVEQGIAAIRLVSSGSGINVYSKTYLVEEEMAFAPGYSRRDQVIWLAGSIVHDACHSNLYIQGEDHHGTAAEVTCLERQLEALELIDDGTHFSNYIKVLIDTADGPGN